MVWQGQAWPEPAPKWRPVRIADDVVVPSRATWRAVGAGDMPDAVAHFEVRDGVPELREVHLVAKPEGRTLLTSDFDAFRSENLTRNVFEALAMSFVGPDPETGEVSMQKATTRQAQRAVDDLPARRPGRPSALTPGELERVARVYLDDESGKPVVAVRERLGYASERTAARRIKQAEEAGHLPPTTRGRRRTAPEES